MAPLPGNMALCLDFVLDVLHVRSLLVYCLIILLVSAYAWFLVFFACTIKLEDHSYRLFLIILRFKESREDLLLQLNNNHPYPIVLPTNGQKSTFVWSVWDAWILRVSRERGTTGCPSSISNSPSVYPYGEGDSVLWVEERIPSSTLRSIL